MDPLQEPREGTGLLDAHHNAADRSHIVLLSLLNGFFAMSETALVSSRKARLRQRADEGDRGAKAALELTNSPNRRRRPIRVGEILL